MTTNQNFSPVAIEGLDCVDNTILTVCQMLRGEYKKVFWDAWRVCYKPCSRIGEGFCYFPKRITENVKRIYGIDFRPLGRFEATESRKLLQQQLDKNGMVVIGIRTNCCPWQKSYRSNDYVVHFLIVTALSDGGIECIDTMPQRQGAVIGWGDVEAGLCSIIEILDWEAFEKKGKTQEVSLRDVWKSAKKNVRPKTIVKLARRIRRDFDVVQEFGTEKNIWKVPLYDMFFRATGAHIQFGMYLKTYPELGEVTLIRKNEALALEWEGLKILTVKFHREYEENWLKREKLEVYMTKYAEVLKTIAEMEEGLLQLLKQQCKKDFSSMETDVAVAQAVQKISYVDVPYNEMTHMVDPKDFIVKRNPEYGKLWETSETTYQLPKRNENEFNCMYCDGQQIRFEKPISKLSFLIYGTYGDQHEQMELIYEDGSEKCDLFVSDWTQKALVGEEIVWQERYINRDPSGINHHGKIVSKTVYVDAEKNCRSVILPTCDKIHILAITVEEKV